MALSEQIEWADHGDRKPVGTQDRLVGGRHLMHMPAQGEQAAGLERALARRYVTRWAGRCGDVAAGAEVLGALGLEAA